MQRKITITEGALRMLQELSSGFAADDAKRVGRDYEILVSDDVLAALERDMRPGDTYSDVIIRRGRDGR